MTFYPESLLPADIRAGACRSNNEWGWPPEMIPQVIEQGKQSNLLSLGGQLQFLLPAGICECYWVSVDLLGQEPCDLDWQGRLALAAQRSQDEFAALRTRYDFLDEGRRAFEQQFRHFEAAGGKPAEHMCFIWYFEADKTP